MRSTSVAFWLQNEDAPLIQLDNLFYDLIVWTHKTLFPIAELNLFVAVFIHSTHSISVSFSV